MLRRSQPMGMRVLCLTMLPDGGALTPALRKLGYQPYTLRSSFQQGNARTHPIEWSLALDRKKKLDKSLFADYDCFVGPPAALLYDTILRDCPSYTRVILVEEPDKARWAIAYDEYLARLRQSLARASNNQVSVHFRNMLEKMVVRGEHGDDTGAGDDRADRGGPRSVRGYGYARTSSPLALERALRAEAAQGRGSGAAAATQGAEPCAHEPMAGNTGAGEGGQEEGGTAEGGVPLTPRAVALARFEESVKMAVPADRLLVYRYGDGWEALCSFLDRPVPLEPFPPYDDGLRVLGFLQERVQWAETVMYGLLALTAGVVLVGVWPYLGGVRRVLVELYQDYQLAFGLDDTATATAPGQPAAAAAGAAAVDGFEDRWRRRGGVVTVDASKSV